jgi:hypothetical protein
LPNWYLEVLLEVVVVNRNGGILYETEVTVDYCTVLLGKVTSEGTSVMDECDVNSRLYYYVDLIRA